MTPPSVYPSQAREELLIPPALCSQRLRRFGHTLSPNQGDQSLSLAKRPNLLFLLDDICC
jgi:hypothetical protein